jgi:hypothetical protein
LSADPIAPPPVALPAAEQGTYGWLVSFAIHAAVVLLLAAASMPPLPLSTSLLIAATPTAAESLDDALDLGDAEVEMVDMNVAVADDSSAAPPIAAPTPDIAAPPAAVTDFSSLLAGSLATMPSDATLAVVAGKGIDGRTAAGKAALVASKGGSAASELAVAQGLKWLANHQAPDGSWSLVHNVGVCNGRCSHPARVPGDEPYEQSRASATGLALLPYLGAGETHLRGRHKRVIRAGLAALVRMGKPDDDNPGLSWADSGKMYAHGICTIALCEAYGLTKDPDLRGPAQAALAYLAYAQDPEGGGWRYSAQEPGDTSVTGWQVMALKSGQLASLAIPTRIAGRASLFLDSASADNGARYGYLAAPQPGEEGAENPYDGTPTLSAVGLLCRMYLGWDRSDERLQRGVERLVEEGPRADNYYHNYYAAQTIFHHTGGEGALWRKWNDAVREQLIAQQSRRDHERGSWWVKGPHNDRGGRLYATALATMTLEVYYRYLPLYQVDAVSTEFPD